MSVRQPGIGRRLRTVDWEAIAGITAAVLALVLHLLHIAQEGVLLAITLVILALMLIRDLHREGREERMLAHEHLQSVALEPVEQRLARKVLVLATKIGQRRNDLTILTVTRQELADMVGTTVETTIRITSKWQRASIVRSARKLAIADAAALRTLAAGDSA